MKTKNLMLAAITVIALLFVGPFSNFGKAFAQGKGIVTVQSKLNFEDTESQLRQLIAKNGMMVLSELNQGKILSMTGISVKAISLFVGNPQVGNKLFTENRAVGLVVPVRLNVYEGNDGKTYVNYVKPSFNLSSFNNEKINKIAGSLDQKLAMLTGMIAK
jgi:uncharacterized protein (DUF302 family)